MGRDRRRLSHCAVCGAEFYSVPNGKSATGWTLYCSRTCYGARLTRQAELRRRVVVKVWRGKCAGCGRPFVKASATQGYCSPACRPCGWKPEARTCIECGAGFVQERRWQRTCSEACAEAVERRNNRVAKAKRRARTRGTAAESIDPIAVFKRDGWRCRMCGVETPYELRGSTHPRAPELDHVIPLAVGGSHTLANVQCACRACNGAKGARLAPPPTVPRAA